MQPEAVLDVIAAAQRERRGLRLHLRDGEVLTARVLGWDRDAVLYAPLVSSRPERYAVCDSTGYSVAISEIERVQLLAS